MIMPWKTKQTDKLRNISSLYNKRLDQDLKTIVGGDGWVSAYDKELPFFQEYEEVDEEEAFQSIMKTISIERAERMFSVFDDIRDTEFGEEILNHSLAWFITKITD